MDTDKTSSAGFCELALPAGSLQCALYAFKGGADAVYFGLKSFSARKGAVNFSFEDVRKIKEYCRQNSKKFYVTLNTLVKNSEMEDVVLLLRQLEYLQPDGIIVQDLGIAHIMRQQFPTLPLHGSTQLAVHTVNGVKELQALGFSRVVLSRELSFEEIKPIRVTIYAERLDVDDGQPPIKYAEYDIKNGEATMIGEPDFDGLKALNDR